MPYKRGWDGQALEAEKARALALGTREKKVMTNPYLLTVY